MNTVDKGLNTQQYEAQIEQLDEIVSKHSETVWASYTPLFAVGSNAGKEKKVEASFALYLHLIDEHLAGRKKQIPRITWRHWYSEEKDEYGYLHFHILYLLDDTGLTAEQMICVHHRVLEQIKAKDRATMSEVREALEEQKLKEWAVKAGHKYQVQKRESRAVVDTNTSIAVKADSSTKLVGYGSKMKKQKRHADAEVYEVYSTTPHHTVLTIR